jgi:hypothetical protein
MSMKRNLVLFVLMVATLFIGEGIAQEVEAINSNFNLQEVFKVGKRNQRVRFFLSDGVNIMNYLAKSPAYYSVVNDDVKDQNSKFSHFAAISKQVNETSFYVFGGASDSTGLIVNFQLLACAIDLGKLLKTSGDKNIDIFNYYKIDEINIFLKPTIVKKHGDYKLSITPISPVSKNPPALNMQIPFLIRKNECMLPTELAIDLALQEAACKGSEQFCPGTVLPTKIK